MEDFTSRTYGTSGLDNRPLFGETSPRDRIINLAVGIVASLLLIMAAKGGSRETKCDRHKCKSFAKRLSFDHLTTRGCCHGHKCEKWS